jgi:hypothetical protein
MRTFTLHKQKPMTTTSQIESDYQDGNLSQFERDDLVTKRKRLNDSAPGLLLALEEMLSLHSEMRHFSGERVECFPHIIEKVNAARAAIAKAKGEALK